MTNFISISTNYHTNATSVVQKNDLFQLEFKNSRK